MLPFLTFLGASAAAFIALAMMFHARHHGVHEHELRIRNLIIDQYNSRERDYERITNLEEQYKIVKRRYLFALAAFVFLMTQSLMFLAGLVFTAVNVFEIDRKYWVLLVPGFLAICCQIFGDLGGARKSQRKSREYVDTLLVRLKNDKSA